VKTTAWARGWWARGWWVSGRMVGVGAVALAALAASAAPAGACAGLVTPGGNVQLVDTATLAAWSNGVEHYVTSFRFEGGGAEFGSIVPLPGVPSKVERGGDWTLQRLNRETHPVFAALSAARDGVQVEADSAQVILETTIDALDITVLKGGGASVGKWAKDHGFQLTPDAPAVLDFYAARSPIFLAARFNAQAARDRGQAIGDGTPIHVTIPLARPWVPLRILGLGKAKADGIDADVYLLTPKRPALLPQAASGGYALVRSEAASTSLLDDLRSDKGMGWMPASMWLSYLRIGATASALHHDLAIEPVHWWIRPSAVAAGLVRPRPPAPPTTAAPPTTITSPTIPDLALFATPKIDGRLAAHHGPATAPFALLALLAVVSATVGVVRVRRGPSRFAANRAR